MIAENCLFWDTLSVPRFIDSHFHLLELEKKGCDCVVLLEQAREAGIVALIDLGADLDQMEKRLAFGPRCDGLFFAIGFSPVFIERKGWRQVVEPGLGRWIGHERVVALGEIGLDYYWDYGTREEQIALFEMQLEFASRSDLAVCVHNRDANDDLFNTLQNFRGRLKGVIHCFTGEYEYAKKLLDLGFSISFAGNITYKSAESIRDTARRMPQERILIETDAPYLAPVPMRGRINTPLFIPKTYLFIAELLAMKPAELEKQVEKNFFDLFMKGKGGFPSLSFIRR
jgi:TatD DNase family protein